MDFVHVLLCLFLLTLLDLQTRLRKDWFFSLLVCVFSFLFPTHNHSGKGQQLPLVQGLPTNTHGCETDVIVWVPFVMLNHGGNYNEESSVMFIVFQSCSLQSCDIGRFCVPCNWPLFSDCYGIPAAYASSGKNKTNKKTPHFWKSYWRALGKWRCFNK